MPSSVSAERNLCAQIAATATFRISSSFTCCYYGQPTILVIKGRRLCRLMCGKALPFRQTLLINRERLRLDRTRHSLSLINTDAPEGLSPSAHQAEKPEHLFIP